MAGLRPGFGRGGITHSLLVNDSGACEVAGGDAAAGDWAGFIQSEGCRESTGLTSLRAAVGATGGAAAIVVC